jgi:sugar/nucleoside kinase (ribokinase family)
VATQWLGRLGNDGVGRLILDDLTDNGVGVVHARIDDQGISPFNLAVYAGEHRRRVGGFLLPNCMAEPTQEDIRLWAAAVGPGDWCLAEIGEIALPAVLAFCNAVAGKARIVFDVDLDPVAQCKDGGPSLLRKLFEFAHIILPNCDAMRSLYPRIPAEAMAAAVSREYERPVVVTAGAEGCYFSEDGSTTTHRPAPEVDVVDTVGAGDAFHGGFLWSLMRGDTLGDAVDVGNACGAANCRAFGAREGMLDAAGLETFRREIAP